MDALLPDRATGLERDDLLARYAPPRTPATPWVRANFVATADGAVSIDGVSGGLGSAADKLLFGVLRELADVVLVGAGTVRAENYRGARRPTLGRTTPPPIAVVTGSAHLDPASVLFTDTAVPPIVLTATSAPETTLAALRAAGADVAVLDELTPPAMLGALAERGLSRVLCEGGPHLFGQLIAADLVDELCLTLSPLLVAGEAGRIAHSTPPDSTVSGVPAPPRGLDLIGLLHDDGHLLLHYRRSSSSDRVTSRDVSGGSCV